MVPHSPLIARSITEVAEAVDGILARSLELGHRLGYFAALYRALTALVTEGVEQGFFDHGRRMERLHVACANRYLAALDRWQEGRPPSRSWQLAFAAAERSRPLILQQLLLSTNAHLNLDFGVAAAEAAPGGELAALEADFERLGEVLAALVARAEEAMGRLSPWMTLLDRAGGRTTDQRMRFSLDVARREAWDFARDLAPLPWERWAALVDLRDREVALVARAVLDPGGPVTAAALIIRCRESRNVGRIIDTLSRAEAPTLEEVDARLAQRRAEAEKEEEAARSGDGAGGTP